MLLAVCTAPSTVSASPTVIVFPDGGGSGILWHCAFAVAAIKKRYAIYWNVKRHH
jgi:hypothetical protein